MTLDKKLERNQILDSRLSFYLFFYLIYKTEPSNLIYCYI